MFLFFSLCWSLLDEEVNSRVEPSIFLITLLIPSNEGDGIFLFSCCLSAPLLHVAFRETNVFVMCIYRTPLEQTRVKMYFYFLVPYQHPSVLSAERRTGTVHRGQVAPLRAGPGHVQAHWTIAFLKPKTLRRGHGPVLELARRRDAPALHSIQCGRIKREHTKPAT